jgi:hypothetical protein
LKEAQRWQVYGKLCQSLRNAGLNRHRCAL